MLNSSWYSRFLVFVTTAFLFADGCDGVCHRHLLRRAMLRPPDLHLHGYLEYWVLRHAHVRWSDLYLMFDGDNFADIVFLTFSG